MPVELLHQNGIKWYYTCIYPIDFGMQEGENSMVPLTVRANRPIARKQGGYRIMRETTKVKIQERAS